MKDHQDHHRHRGVREARVVTARREIEQLVALAHRLAGDELEVLLLIARRLDAGRRRYGALDLRRDPRDFSGEALEELADAAVYLAAAVLRGGHRGSGHTPDRDGS